MPEGPECRHITDCLQQMVVGKQLLEVSILGGRYLRHGPFQGYQDFNNTLQHNLIMVENVNCHGKFIYWKFNNKYSLWNTLGMSGQWTSTLDKHCHIEFKFQDGQIVYFRDIRNFGTLKLVDNPSLLETKLHGLGTDILDNTPLELDSCLSIFNRRKKWNICKLLMDQSYFSGVGNYIKSEALYSAKINPFSLVEDLSVQQLYTLYQAIREVAHNRYRSKGASFQTFQDPDRNKGKYSYQFKVYGQTQVNIHQVKRDVTPDKRSTYWVPEVCVKNT